MSGIWLFQSGSPFSVLSSLGTLNRGGVRSNATNTASINGTTSEQLKQLSGQIFMTGKGPYFVSPSIIGADGRGVAAFGSAPFSGQTFFNPGPGSVGNLQRRMFSGPWLWSWDASAKKSFVTT